MGSDILEACLGQGKINFNPRSPDGERPARRHGVYHAIHFNPRSPDGERLGHLIDDGDVNQISIHAPRMGSDSKRSPSYPHTGNFNPRSPDGERPGLHC